MNDILGFIGWLVDLFLFLLLLVYVGRIKYYTQRLYEERKQKAVD